MNPAEWRHFLTMPTFACKFGRIWVQNLKMIRHIERIVGKQFLLMTDL
jgi:hypothetical protein